MAKLFLAKMRRGFGCPSSYEARASVGPGMEIGYVVKDAKSGRSTLQRSASESDPGYYVGLLKEAWMEAVFVFAN